LIEPDVHLQRFGVHRVHGFFSLNAFLLGFPFIAGFDCITNGIALSGECGGSSSAGLTASFSRFRYSRPGLSIAVLLGNHAPGCDTVTAFFSGTSGTSLPAFGFAQESR
jgi:hypothetical protein